MKKVIVFSFLGLGLVGCSSKEPLDGVRKDLILSEVQTDDADKSPVVVDPSSATLGRDLQLHWLGAMEFGKSKSLRMISPAVAADGKIFCLDAGGLVYAFNAKNGAQLWRKTTTLKGKDGQVGGALCYGDGKLVVTSSFAEAFAFDAVSGKMLWRIKIPACCKGDRITIDNGKAYLLCDNSSLQVVSLSDGKLLWSHSGMMIDTTYIGSSSVIVRNDVVYLSYPSGEVFALMENGSELWSAMLSKFSFTNAGESFSHPRACPVIKDNLIYFTGANQQITAFDIRTGNVVWKKDFGGLETPLVSGNSLFVLNSSSELVCLNKDNGKVKWTRRLKIGDDVVYGWFGQTKVSIDWFGPIQTSEGLLMLASNGNLVTVSPTDGTIKSATQLDDFGQGMTARPVIADGMLYLIVNDGSVQAYKSV